MKKKINCKYKPQIYLQGWYIQDKTFDWSERHEIHYWLLQELQKYLPPPAPVLLEETTCILTLQSLRPALSQGPCWVFKGNDHLNNSSKNKSPNGFSRANYIVCVEEFSAPMAVSQNFKTERCHHSDLRTLDDTKSWGIASNYICTLQIWEHISRGPIGKISWGYPSKSDVRLVYINYNF